jgi:hypothetical protein
MYPDTFSAGNVTSQPTKPERSPKSPRMFHRAFVLRLSLVIGAIVPVRSSNARKSSTPWAGGSLPVAIEVQMSGESMGSYVRSRPEIPSSSNLARWGMRPLSISSSTTSQSAPSQPITTMRGRTSREGSRPQPGAQTTAASASDTKIMGAGRRINVSLKLASSGRSLRCDTPNFERLCGC